MKGARLPLLCAGLTAAALTLSSHVGWLWWLGWIAPAPLLWFAFGPANPMRVLAAALGAGALVGLGAVSAYAALLPEASLGAILVLSAVGLAACVLPARFAARALSPLAGPIVFAALWTVWDFVAAAGPDGMLFSPALSQAPAPMLIQIAALFGGWAITFLLGAVAGCIALAFRYRKALLLLPAAALFMADLGIGALHLQRAQGPDRRVVLIDSDPLSEASAIDRRDIALGAVLAYAAEIRLKARGADLVVLPERIAVLRPAWRDDAVDVLRAAARGSGATIVAGFAARDGQGAHNIALTIAPDGGVQTYRQGTALSGTGGTSVAISHDLNFVAAMRAGAVRLQAGLMAVPAWDFGSDGLAEAHKAILRGVENGVAIARTARDGRLMLADAQGRVVAEAPSESADFAVLARNLPAGASPGRTLYDRIGDGFVWAAGMLAFALLAAALSRLVSTAPITDLRRFIPARPARSIAWAQSAPALRRAASPRER